MGGAGRRQCHVGLQFHLVPLVIAAISAPLKVPRSSSVLAIARIRARQPRRTANAAARAHEASSNLVLSCPFVRYLSATRQLGKLFRM
jgi:hypothetical protein